MAGGDFWGAAGMEGGASGGGGETPRGGEFLARLGSGGREVGGVWLDGRGSRRPRGEFLATRRKSPAWERRGRGGNSATQRRSGGIACAAERRFGLGPLGIFQGGEEI